MRKEGWKDLLFSVAFATVVGTLLVVGGLPYLTSVHNPGNDEMMSLYNDLDTVVDKTHRDQEKVMMYDRRFTFTENLAKNLMTRVQAQAELDSGLHPGGIIIPRVNGSYLLPPVDATNVVFDLDKPINKVVVKEPTGLILDGREIAVEFVKADRR